MIYNLIILLAIITVVRLDNTNSIKFEPLQDVHLEGNSVNAVYGDETSLPLKLDISTHSWPKYNRIACYKFPTPEIECTDAKINLYVTGVGQGLGGPVSNMKLGVYKTDFDVNEESSTWNSFQCSSKTRGARMYNNIPVAQTWFVTDNVMSFVDDDHLSFCVEVMTAENGGSLTSRESEENKPFIEYSDCTEPEPEIDCPLEDDIYTFTCDLFTNTMRIEANYENIKFISSCDNDLHDGIFETNLDNECIQNNETTYKTSIYVGYYADNMDTNDYCRIYLTPTCTLQSDMSFEYTPFTPGVEYDITNDDDTQSLQFEIFTYDRSSGAKFTGTSSTSDNLIGMHHGAFIPDTYTAQNYNFWAVRDAQDKHSFIADHIYEQYGIEIKTLTVIPCHSLHIPKYQSHFQICYELPVTADIHGYYVEGDYVIINSRKLHENVLKHTERGLLDTNVTSFNNIIRTPILNLDDDIFNDDSDDNKWTFEQIILVIVIISVTIIISSCCCCRKNNNRYIVDERNRYGDLPVAEASIFDNFVALITPNNTPPITPRDHDEIHQDGNNPSNERHTTYNPIGNFIHLLKSNVDNHGDEIEEYPVIDSHTNNPSYFTKLWRLYVGDSRITKITPVNSNDIEAWREQRQNDEEVVQFIESRKPGNEWQHNSQLRDIQL